MRILIFGDVVAKPGRKALAAVLPKWKREYCPDFVLANVENLAHGTGATDKTLAELRAADVDCFTSGNHIWDKDSRRLLEDPTQNILRPANYPPNNPGVGMKTLDVNGTPVIIINLLGRVFFRESADCPFRAADALLASLIEAKPRSIVVVDFHAEATSEKVALGHYLDGRVTCVYGTHTHVPTADAMILPKGTAYITDVGMTGLVDSVIGADKESVIQMFLTQTPSKAMHDAPERGAVTVNAMLLETDHDGAPASWQRIFERVDV